MSAVIDRKIQKLMDEEIELAIKNGDELPNQCLGPECKVRLPHGYFFCKECRDKKNRRRPLNSTSDISHRCGILLAGEAR